MLPGLENRTSRSGFTNLLLGFFGVLGAALILPRLAKFGVRRFFMGIISEVLLILLSGLLTEKLVRMISNAGDEEADLDHPRANY